MEYSQKEIIKNAGLAKATAVKWLNYLVKQDFLMCKTIGVTNLYSIKKEKPLIKQLKIAYTLGMLIDLKIPNTEMYLYGSASRGEDVEVSDIDLLLLGNEKKHTIIDLIEKYSNKIGKKISIVQFTQSEWSMIAKKDPAFFERVEKDKIRID
jgi:predicted nucleotidyltransferase